MYSTTDEDDEEQTLGSNETNWKKSIHNIDKANVFSISKTKIHYRTEKTILPVVQSLQAAGPSQFQRSTFPLISRLQLSSEIGEDDAMSNEELSETSTTPFPHELSTLKMPNIVSSNLVASHTVTSLHNLRSRDSQKGTLRKISLEPVFSSAVSSKIPLNDTQASNTSTPITRRRTRSNATNVPPLLNLIKDPMKDAIYKYPLACRYFKKWSIFRSPFQGGDTTVMEKRQREKLHHETGYYNLTRFPSSPEFTKVLQDIYNEDMDLR